jgi:hypothetical protein
MRRRCGESAPRSGEPAYAGLAALLIGPLAGLARPVLLLSAAVFIIAGLYEVLRSPRNGTNNGLAVVAIWLVVGLGYLVRGGLGLRLAGLAWTSLPMIAGLVCIATFGILFVLLTWVLEATSYCTADTGGAWAGRSWTASPARAGTAVTTACCGPARGYPRRGRRARGRRGPARPGRGAVGRDHGPVQRVLRLLLP